MTSATRTVAPPATGRRHPALAFTGLTLLFAVCFLGAIALLSPSPQILAAQRQAAAGQAEAPALLLLLVLGAASIAYPARRAVVGGWRLALALALSLYGLVTFMAQIETAWFLYAFPLIDTAELAKLFARGALTAAVFVPFAVSWYGPGAPGARPAVLSPRSLFADVPWRTWAVRIPLLALAYVALYLLFGYFVAWQFADLREFYSGSRAPTGFLDQVSHALLDDPGFGPFQFLRGLLWIGFSVPVLLVLRDRRASAVTLALMLAVFGSQLLLPNAFFPTSVRIAHFYETTSSTVLFGVLVAWLLPVGRRSVAAV